MPSHPVDPALARSAARAGALELPEALADEIAEVWLEVEQLASPSLAAAYDQFTAELAVIPHPWAKRHVALAPGSSLTARQALRLALLALGELGLAERREYGGRVEAQPWFRGYALLADATREPEALARFARPLRWLIVDACIDACELDTRGNSMQTATGWLSCCWRIDRDAGLDLEPSLRRMWTLAERGFTADGYDDGSYELSFADLADHVNDPILAGQLRLIHAFMDYASTPWEAYNCAQLRAALRAAEQLELDIDQLRQLSLPIIGSFYGEELPVDPDAVPGEG